MKNFVLHMKYLRSTCVIFLLCGLWMHDASSQDAFDPMMAGLKAGANLNQFSQTCTTIDVNGSAMLHYQFSNLLAVQAEMLYMGIGGGVLVVIVPIFV